MKTRRRAESTIDQNFEACGIGWRAIDITSAVHYRMVPEAVRAAFQTSDRISETQEAQVFRRLFPSMREEGQFRFLAGCGKGAIFCSPQKIHYVPEAVMEHASEQMNANVKRELAEALSSYDPLSQAVVVISGCVFAKVVIAGAEDFPDGLRG